MIKVKKEYKNYFKILLYCLVVIHVLVLIVFGISFFTTKIVFYFLLYKIVVTVINLLGINVNLKEKIQYNIKAALCVLFLFEFVILIVIPSLNTSSENTRYMYISEYKYPLIDKVMQTIFKKETRLTYENGYERNSTGKYLYKKDLKVRYNELGFRGKAFDKTKGTNEKRITILGDSFVEGHGVEDTQTMPYYLEKLLNIHDSHDQYKVFNAGVCGADPLSEINYFNKRLTDLQNDLVVLVIYENDNRDMNIRGGTERYIANGLRYKKTPISEYFYAASHVFRVFSNIYDVFIKPRFEECKPKNEILIKNAIEEFVSKYNTHLLVFYLPGRNTEETCFERNLNEILSHDEDIPYYNIRKNYIGNKIWSDDKYFLINDDHHSSSGNKFLAEIIKEKIEDYYREK